MEPGVHVAGWKEVFADVFVTLQTIRPTSGAAENPIGVPWHPIRKSLTFSSCTEVVRLPR
jgi:hypothetical protein